MSVRKLARNGKTTWGYVFDLPGSSRADRKRAAKWGFATKKKAAEAEAARRIEEEQKAAASARGIAVLPRTLGELLEEWLKEYVSKLEPKTQEDYYWWIRKLGAPLLALPVQEINALHLTREWNRLAAEGGRHHITKRARPLGVKTVKLVKAAVSSAFTWAIGQGMATSNPVRDSVVPRGQTAPEAAVLTPAQQRLLIDAAQHSDVPRRKRDWACAAKKS